MSRKSSKHINKINKSIIRMTMLLILITNILPLVFLNYTKVFKCISVLKVIPELLAFLLLFWVSKPKNRLEAGTDLRSRGVISLLFDFIYVSILGRVLSYFTNLFYLIYFIMVVSVWYEFFGRKMGVVRR